MWLYLYLVLFIWSVLTVVRGILSACSRNPPSNWTRPESVWTTFRRISVAEAVIFTFVAGIAAGCLVNEVRK